ncbi:MAG: fibronectin type III domain-containing protein [Acidimicrobiales bacterium]
MAGTGTQGYSGDGGSATAASLSGPSALTASPGGDVFFFDSGNHRVRRISAGTISTVVGNGSAGFSGDGGAATAASIDFITQLALDGSGNLYLADGNQRRVRKVTGGTITTVAGNGSATFSGDGGAATSAGLDSVGGITVDNSGSLYLSSQTRVRKVTSGTITTIAGGPTSGFAGDGGPAATAQLSMASALSAAGSGLYLLDANRVRRIDTGGTITTVVGNGSAAFSGDNGSATTAQLDTPQGITFDPSGNLYVADASNDRVRRITPAGTITTVAGSGSSGFSGDGAQATSAKLRGPADVAVDAAGNLYIADAGNDRVRKVTPAGVISTVAGTGAFGSSGDGGPAAAATFRAVDGVAVDTSGNLYIADGIDHRIRKVAPGGTITTFAGTGTAGYSGDGGPATAAALNHPVAVDTDAAGNVYISDGNNARIRRVAPAGTITTVAGNGSFGFSGDNGAATAAALANPSGVAFDATGAMYVADSSNYRVRRVANGTISTVAGTGTDGFSGDGAAATAARVTGPASVAVDASGSVHFSDVDLVQLGSHGSNRIRKVVAATTPGAPIGVAAVAGNQAATVTWTAPTSNGGSPITGYTVTSNPAGKTCSWTTGPLTCVVSGLTNGTAYTFTVTATNIAGTSAASSTSPAVVPAATTMVPAQPRLDRIRPWIDVVNWYRAGAGLPAVTDNPVWSDGIRKHLDYLNNTPLQYFTGPYVSWHTENPASPWYTPEGAAAAQSSDLGGWGTSDRESIEGWITAPFHAVGIIRRNLTQAAYYRQPSGGGAGLDVIRGLSGGSGTAPVLFPGPNSVVGLHSMGAEVPNPVERCGYTTGPGLPMIALLPQAPPAGTTATLVDDKGTSYDVCEVDQNNFVTSDPVYGQTGHAILEGDHAVFVVPRSPLADGRYTVSIHQPSKPDITWSFFIAGYQTDQIGGLGVVPVHVTDTPNATVIGNLTVTQPGAAGYTTAFPCSGDRPLASNNNYLAGQTIPNFAVVQADANGNICLYTKAAGHLIWDQVGATTAFGVSAPTRVFDSRTSGKLAKDGVATVHVTDVPNATVLGNLTVTQPDESGFTTAFPCSGDRPLASNNNYLAGQTIPNFAVVQADANGNICLYTTASAHLIWDQVGATTAFGVSTPTRVFDSRVGGAKVAKGGVATVHVTDVPNATVLGNLTVTQPDESGFTTAYPCAGGRPLASNNNYLAGQTIPNFAVVQADANGNICLYTTASAHLIWDQVGATTAFGVSTPTRVFDSRVN